MKRRYTTRSSAVPMASKPLPPLNFSTSRQARPPPTAHPPAATPSEPVRKTVTSPGLLRPSDFADPTPPRSGRLPVPTITVEDDEIPPAPTPAPVLSPNIPMTPRRAVFGSQNSSSDWTTPTPPGPPPPTPNSSQRAAYMPFPMAGGMMPAHPMAMGMQGMNGMSGMSQMSMPGMGMGLVNPMLNPMMASQSMLNRFGMMMDYSHRSTASALTFDCPLCSLALPAKYLRKHVHEHLSYTPIRCNLCGHFFYDREDIKFHYEVTGAHGKNAIPQVIEMVHQEKHREAAKLLSKVKGYQGWIQAQAEEAEARPEGTWRLDLDQEEAAPILDDDEDQGEEGSQGGSPSTDDEVMPIPPIPPAVSKAARKGQRALPVPSVSLREPKIAAAARATPLPSRPEAIRSSIPRPTRLDRPNVVSKLTGLQNLTAMAQEQLTSIQGSRSAQKAAAPSRLSLKRPSASPETSPPPSEKRVKTETVSPAKVQQESGTACRLCHKKVNKYPVSTLRNHVAALHLSSFRVECRYCDFVEKGWYPQSIKRHLATAHPEKNSDDYIDRKAELSGELDVMLKRCFSSVKDAFGRDRLRLANHKPPSRTPSKTPKKAETSLVRKEAKEAASECLLALLSRVESEVEEKTEVAESVADLVTSVVDQEEARVKAACLAFSPKVMLCPLPQVAPEVPVQPPTDPLPPPTPPPTATGALGLLMDYIDEDCDD